MISFALHYKYNNIDVLDDATKSQMSEAHFCALESQSNIYGLSHIDLPSRATEILASSLRGKNGPKVISLRVLGCKPISKEIRFNYIPGISF